MRAGSQARGADPRGRSVRAGEADPSAEERESDGAFLRSETLAYCQRQIGTESGLSAKLKRYDVAPLATQRHDVAPPAIGCVTYHVPSVDPNDRMP